MRRVAAPGAHAVPAPTAAPRLGFLGVGWIGRHRLRALAEAGVAEVAAIADAAPDAVAAARAEAAPDAIALTAVEELLDPGLRLDGVVIATPSALHAGQATAALDQGLAVFCQKPLARDEAETRAVVDVARGADRLLGVDMAYRHVEGARVIRELVLDGHLGNVYAADLTFHNAYGPDKGWFYDVALSGGGCVIDLGVHLVDLALWTLGHPSVGADRSRLFHRGEPLPSPPDRAEDHAVATLELQGTVVRVACSWNLAVGRDAVIEATFHGSDGGASLRNVGGSFYDFVAERYRGTATEVLASPPDAWGGRAIVAWARALGAGAGFDPEVERLVEVAGVIDRIYGR